MKISKDAQNAIRITLLCSLTYLAVYLNKNILSAVSPQMIERGVISQNNLGVFSSTYFICYALGQLINGMIAEGCRYTIVHTGLDDGHAGARKAYGKVGFQLNLSSAVYYREL